MPGGRTAGRPRHDDERPTAPFLKLTGVSKRFGGVLALDRIDWDVRPGEVHCLVGENGCGKSTLIKLVAGVHQPDPGSEIEIGGVAQRALGPAEAKSLGIQVIYQDLSLFPNLSVAENIAFDHNLGGPRAPGPLRPHARDRARAARAPGRRAAARRAGRLPVDRRAPGGRDLPRPRRRRAAAVHGRAHRLADPGRGQRTARLR